MSAGAAEAAGGIPAWASSTAAVTSMIDSSPVPEAAGRRRVKGNMDIEIAVDMLEDVEAVEIAPRPPGMGGASDAAWDFVSGVAERGQETLLALDIDRLVARAGAIE